MKNTILVRVSTLLLAAFVAFTWGGLAASMARADAPSAGALMAPAGTRLHYAGGVALSQAITGPADARDAMLRLISESSTLVPPPVGATWTEENTTPPMTVGASSYKYTSGDWVVNVSYSVVLHPIYYVTVDTSVVMGNEVAYYSWKGQVDETGNFIQFTGTSSISNMGGKGMPTTGGAPGTDLPVALLIASLLSIIGAGAIISWRWRVRPGDETYILN